jgi:hypothetical protein
MAPSRSGATQPQIHDILIGGSIQIKRVLPPLPIWPSHVKVHTYTVNSDSRGTGQKSPLGLVTASIDGETGE